MLTVTKSYAKRVARPEASKTNLGGLPFAVSACLPQEGKGWGLSPILTWRRPKPHCYEAAAKRFKCERPQLHIISTTGASVRP
jgi:hypothetical protein